MDRENLIISQQLNNLKAPSQNDGFLQKGRRRSKKDKVNRDFICGCSKSYLSYPALYTHIKNKHNGQPPKGTIVPSVNRPTKPVTERASSMSKSRPNRSALGGTRNDNLSQLADDDDFMAERLKDGHVVDADFAQKDTFAFDFSLEDFELVNFLGMQGTCEPEYSFYDTRRACDHRIQSMAHAANVLDYLDLAAVKVTGCLQSLQRQQSLLGREPSASEPEDSSDTTDELVLRIGKWPSRPVRQASLRPASDRVSLGKRIKAKTAMLQRIASQKRKAQEDLRLLQLKDQSNAFGNDDHEGYLKRLSAAKKHPLFHAIKAGTSSRDSPVGRANPSQGGPRGQADELRPGFRQVPGGGRQDHEARNVRHGGAHVPRAAGAGQPVRLRADDPVRAAERSRRF